MKVDNEINNLLESFSEVANLSNYILPGTLHSMCRGVDII